MMACSQLVVCYRNTSRSSGGGGGGSSSSNGCGNFGEVLPPCLKQSLVGHQH